MRHLAFFTGTRAEYDLLRPLILKAKDSEANLSVIASGTHLLASHGHTIDALKKDGLNYIEVPILHENSVEEPLYAIMGNALQKYGEILGKINPDLLVVLGDRYETFCAAIASTVLRIPIAHLHGGELTLGALDDAFRHSITKMAYFHFTSCEEHRKRVIQLGEEPDRVWNFGAIGVENALAIPNPPVDLKKRLGIGKDRQFLLCTVHPVTLEPGAGIEIARNILDALKEFSEFDVLFTAANADPEGQEITEIFWNASSDLTGRFHFCPSLGFPGYLWAATQASAVIGNSSSGIIEIPSLNTPVINIGNRQKGRVCSDAVINCGASSASIINAMRCALNEQYKEKIQLIDNPYESRETSRRIAQILLNHDLPRPPEKSFFDL